MKEQKLLKRINLGVAAVVFVSIFVFGGDYYKQIASEFVNVAEAATAPKLTYFQVVKVTSTLGGTETMTDSQYNTVKDHGGTKLRIFVKELGYGKNPIATLNGKNLTLASKTSILSGTTVIGWMLEWNADGMSGGTFKTQDTSLVYPYNTMYDSVYVK